MNSATETNKNCENLNHVKANAAEQIFGVCRMIYTCASCIIQKQVFSSYGPNDSDSMNACWT